MKPNKLLEYTCIYNVQVKMNFKKNIHNKAFQTPFSQNFLSSINDALTI